MKRVSFVLMIALALVASAPAIAQQATATGRGQTLCRDTKGAAYSQGAMVKTPDGSIEVCDGGRWEPATQPSTAPGQQPAARPDSRASVENVRLELTISDQSGGAQPIKKVITMLLAERAQGRVRSGGEVLRSNEAGQGSYFAPVTLNADANVVGIAGDRIRVMVTVEYMPAAGGSDAGNRRTQLNQSVDVVLTNAKPVLIVESADPISDRKVSLTATATIVR
jgi:hypothetical protein